MYKTFNNAIRSNFENRPISKITCSDIAKSLNTINYPHTQKLVKTKLNLLFKYAKTYYNLKFTNNFKYLC